MCVLRFWLWSLLLVIHVDCDCQGNHQPTSHLSPFTESLTRNTNPRRIYCSILILLCFLCSIVECKRSSVILELGISNAPSSNGSIHSGRICMTWLVS